MKFFFVAIVGGAALIGTLFFLLAAVPKEIVVSAGPDTKQSQTILGSLKSLVGVSNYAPSVSSSPSVVSKNHSGDISEQTPLSNPPKIVKAVYITSWSAGSPGRINSIIDLIRRTELNAVVIDIKDYSGYVAYVVDNPILRASGALDQIRILQPNVLIKQLHDNGIYVIGRISIFQDPILAYAHPEWALRNKTTGKVWTDRKGLAWMDPAAKSVWDYNLAITEDALRRGFDEINFDYIRFASDGDLGNISYPLWDEKTPRHAVIKKFFQYVRERLPNATLSADLFGLATVNNDDLGIGQVIEDAFEYFDYVSPMIYPSHYASGFLGFKNPALYPYEVVKYSLEHAATKLQNYETQMRNSTSTSLGPSTSVRIGKLRPWLQDFDLGATYDAEMVKKQMQAVRDALSNASGTDRFTGWLLWDPSNTYTAGALAPENN